MISTWCVVYKSKTQGFKTICCTQLMRTCLFAPTLSHLGDQVAHVDHGHMTRMCQSLPLMLQTESTNVATAFATQPKQHDKSTV